jgi:imidazoleglycerol-phosphate dehydratase
VALVEEFCRALANNAMINLHVNVPYGGNDHHVAEAIFKALGQAIRAAVARDDRVTDVPSTKGTL